jgi:hypothetical protein
MNDEIFCCVAKLFELYIVRQSFLKAFAHFLLALGLLKYATSPIWQTSRSVLHPLLFVLLATQEKYSHTSAQHL